MTNRIDHRWTGPARGFESELSCGIIEAAAYRVKGHHNNATFVGYKIELADKYGIYDCIYATSNTLVGEHMISQGFASLEATAIASHFNREKKLSPHIITRLDGKPSWWKD